MQTTVPDLSTITNEIWTAMFGIGVEPADDGADHARGERVVTGVVQLTGDAEGAVTVQCSDRLARRATATMFAVDVTEVSDEDLSDCIGELANMTGGNVKSALDGHNELSLPSVTVGRDYEVTVRGSRVVQRRAFDAAGDTLVVTLLTRDRA